MSADVDAIRSDSEDDDETWALELEEELLTGGPSEGSGDTSLMTDPLASGSGGVSPDTQHAPSTTVTRLAGPSLANELPHEVLVNIVGFTPVGRVSKAWSLASSTLARRKFFARLTDTLLVFTSDANTIAQEVETALFNAYGQPFSLPKAYGQKARQLLFNLKDSRNEALRERLFTGELPASTLVRMSASDMANPQLVKQRQQWIKKRTHEVMRDTRALEGFTQTEMFECRSCGSHRTCYRQWRRKAIVDRTRVIVICRDCPYRWEL